MYYNFKGFIEQRFGLEGCVVFHPNHMAGTVFSPGGLLMSETDLGR